uniref:Uncharacterized protein n=1 Tax=Neobodo designis TaxID=312471 RepID=A0A7S1PKV9_NEODS
MLHNVPLKAKDEKAGSSKWHNLKEQFRFLFRPADVPVIEDWYNLVAPQRHRETFRAIMKAIRSAPEAEPIPADGSVALEQHRAAHMMQLYGKVFSEQGQARARSWLLTGTAAEVDRFRDVFTAISKSLAVQTTTKEAFVQRPVADPIAKTNNRRKIDWNSDKAAEQMRNHHNPMAGERLPTIPPAGKSGGNSQRGSRGGSRGMDSAPKAADEPAFEERCDDTFRKLHDKQRQSTLEGVYTVTEDGATVYQPKPRVPLDKTRERIVSTIGNQPSSWKSTTREHIRNHGQVAREIVVADKHPAIARVTASLGLCVPTLKPKTLAPGASRS